MNSAKAIVVSSVALAGAGALCAATTAAVLYGRRGRRGRQPLRGRIVLITGASRGLGLALAEEFGRRGARLVITARDPWELERARSLLLRRKAIASSEDIFVIPADLRQESEAERLIESATERFGKIDILVNNAGIISVGPVENQTVKDFHDAMDSNFHTGVHSALSVLPQMLQRGSGTIVNIASVGGKVAVPHLLPYTASKFALVGFSEGLHAELRSKGVRVLTVCPGLMRTGSHLNARFAGDAAREYRWFSLSANLPGLSVSAAYAARRIVRAVILGKAEISITPQAALAARLGNVAPEFVARTMEAVNRFLPRSVPESSLPRRGAAVRDLEIALVAKIGRAAARRYNQPA